MRYEWGNPVDFLSAPLWIVDKPCSWGLSGRPAPGIRRRLGGACHPLGVTDLLSFTCPRCGTAADDRYYGPCGSCRTALRREVAGEARVVEGAAYEPKMNVTPNAVALKDD